MNGIIVDGFETMLKQNQTKIDDILDNTRNLENDIDLLSNCIVGEDLNFLMSKLKSERIMLDRVLNKVYAYQQVLKNVCMFYQHQDNQIASDINNLIS